MTPAWILICLGLLAGTFLARVLPFWVPRIETLPPRLRRFLDAVPAAALGALLLPDAFVGTVPVIAAAVVGTAFILTLRGSGITVVVVVSIALAWIGLNMIG